MEEWWMVPVWLLCHCLSDIIMDSAVSLYWDQQAKLPNITQKRKCKTTADLNFFRGRRSSPLAIRSGSNTHRRNDQKMQMSSVNTNNFHHHAGVSRTSLGWGLLWGHNRGYKPLSSLRAAVRLQPLPFPAARVCSAEALHRHKAYSHSNASQITAGFTCCVLHVDRHKVS